MYSFDITQDESGRWKKAWQLTDVEAQAMENKICLHNESKEEPNHDY